MSPYPGFKALNERRLELVNKRYIDGLSGDEKRELTMLFACVEAMTWYRFPTRFPRIPKKILDAMKELRLSRGQ